MKRTRLERIRLGVIFVLVAGFFSIAAARLVHLQVFQSTRYSAIVVRQSSSTIRIPAERGAIFDRNGQLVAKNVIARSLYAWPRTNQELARIGSYLENLYDLRRGTAVKRYRLRVKQFSWIKRRLPDRLADQIASEAPSGLHLRRESRRTYPFGIVGKQILGFTDIDNQGQSGFELASDSILAGKLGTADVRKDARQKTYRVNETAVVKPRPGRSAILTVDWRLQEIVEAELVRSVKQYQAKSGMAVFLDCNSGDILAAAHFDPKERYPERPAKLRAISDQFEPGSVFKIFTAAALMDAGLIDYADSVFCENGKWRVDRRTLHDDKKHGWLNFRSVMELSSNIGIAKFALEMPPEELFAVYRKFGFGQKLRLGLPGEASGSFNRPQRWSDYNIAAMTMGHSIATTPMQLAAAIAAVANGGRLMRPRLVLGYVDQTGNLVREIEAQEICRVFDESISDSLRSILRGVVVNGTAKPVNSEVIAIAGKTGTAEIPDLVNGGYHKNHFSASFGGFFPYDRPIIAGLVLLEDPRPITYGGYTAGVAFKRIAESYSIINPDAFVMRDRILFASNDRLENIIEVPDLVGRDISLARQLAEESGISLRASAEEGIVSWQFPPADRILFEGDELIVSVRQTDSDQQAMADLRGLPIRMVAAFLHQLGIDFQVDGVGAVVRQSIKPGTMISPGSVRCRLVCRST